MECFVCSMELNEGYLCEKHAKILVEMLEKSDGIVEMPQWIDHCLICGQYEDRVIVEYPNCGCFCNKDIWAEWDRYKNELLGDLK